MKALIVAGIVAGLLVGVPAWLAKQERERFRREVMEQERARKYAGWYC